MRYYHLTCLGLCLVLASCSSDPSTFTSYARLKGNVNGHTQVDVPKFTDALALDYADSVETVFRAKATGARYTREASNTALAGLATFTAASKTLNATPSTIVGMGLVSAGIVQLQQIFDAKGRNNAYFEAAERIHGAVREFVASNLNDISDTALSPNGWILANVVQANIDMVDKVLNGHLPTPADLVLATEPMTPDNATPKGSFTPAKPGASAHDILAHREGIIPIPKDTTPPAAKGTDSIRAQRGRIVNMLEGLGKPGAAEKVIAAKSLTADGSDMPEITVCKAILAAAPAITGVDPTISKINHFQRNATPDQLTALETAMDKFLK